MTYVPGRGLDVGTSFIISARQFEEGSRIQYTEFRDAFFRMKPTSPIAKKMMEKGLAGQHYFVDEQDGSFVVVGQDAIERAIERNQSASRPLERGVISPKEKAARVILRQIFKEILGTPVVDQEKVVYSVPAQPVDQPADQFDVGYHTDALNNDLRGLGYCPQPLNEAEAICYSEGEEDNYTLIALSWGAGMVNVCLMSAGEPVLAYSTSRSGDWIDRMAAQASATTDTIVQVEKEHGKFIVGQEVPDNSVLSAVALYYSRLIDYTVQHLIAQLSNAQQLPKFTEPVPIVIAGGTSRAQGFVAEFERLLDVRNQGQLPFEIKSVRAAKDSLRAVSRGLLLASLL